MKRNALALLGVVALAACGEVTPARTQVMVVVDSNLDVPSELDELAFRVRGPDGATKNATAELGSGTDALPRSLALVHEGGPLEPLEVVVEGRLGGKLVLDRAARLAWVSGKTLVLPMHLLRACVDVECGAGTCTETGCESVDVDPESLPTWSGQEPRLALDGGAATGDDGPATDGPGTDGPGTDGAGDPDAGGGGGDGTPGSDGGDMSLPDGGGASTPDGGMTSMPDAGGNTTPDAGMCVAASETCNNVDDDCDGVADNGFDKLTDEANCGVCNRVCAGAKNICCNGTCQKTCN